MLSQELVRRLAILVDLRRNVPRYALQQILYFARSRRDRDWLETPQIVRVSGAGDFSLEVVPQDRIGRFLYLYGVWDLLSTRLFLAFLRPGMTVLDVGANLGYFSVLAANRVAPSGLVYSFEPHDEIRARLIRNIARNGISNVEVRSEAVTSVTAETSFYRSADDSNQGISSTVAKPTPDGDLRERKPLLVPGICLDDVAEHVPQNVDLVKIDVEGAERAVIEGGGRLLHSREAPLIVFEAYDVEAPTALLQACGYTIHRLAHDRRRGIRLVKPPEAGGRGEPNYVASKTHHERALSRFL